jgi:predicted alpha-1,6-mannanase (GH76 family)
LAACGNDTPNGPDKPDPGVVTNPDNIAKQNLRRAMQIMDSVMTKCFSRNGDDFTMYVDYNPYTGVRSNDKENNYEYMSSLEAANAILHGLKALKDDGDAELYDTYFDYYKTLLKQLCESFDFYLGSFTLTSYTQTRQWSVYGVHRHDVKGTTPVSGVENVYDDQEWFIRELMEAYKLTGDNAYLEKAEYLTDYVLDGWDCVRDASGNEYGGICWGPGYVSKHACSNGPMVSPLVWLHEVYKDRNDEITYRDIEVDTRARISHTVKKADYYLLFAKKIYDWEKLKLRNSEGVYMDNYHGCTPSSPGTERINGVNYRRGISCTQVNGPPISYNSGSMLSGAVDLYRATNDAVYLNDAKKLADDSFTYFAKLGTTLPGYYTYDVTGNNSRFNGVLMRAFVDVYPYHSDAAATYVGSFQQNLDYAYDYYYYKGFLPLSHLMGWSRSGNENNKVRTMFSLTFVAEYATLAKYEAEK